MKLLYLTLAPRMGHYVDGLKFAGGSFSLFPEDKLKELIDLAHHHDVYVSTVRTISLLKYPSGTKQENLT